MAKANVISIKPGRQHDHSSAIAALRLMARVAGEFGGLGITLTETEAYGMDVVLTMIADKIEKGAA